MTGNRTRGGVGTAATGRRVAKGGGGKTVIQFVVVVILSLGVGMLFPLIGGLFLVLGLIALVLGLSRSGAYVCSACGNGVADTSTLCPTCHTRLAAPEPRSGSGLAVVVLIIAGVVSLLTVDRWWPLLQPLIGK